VSADSVDPPDRPGVAALVAELEVRRHVRNAAVAGVAFALAVFLLFAYLPGTEESLLYWGALAFVLAFAASGLIATVLLGYSAYRRTRAVGDVEPGGRSPTTLAVVLGLLGWVLLPVGVALAFDRVGPGFELAVATLVGGFVVLVVGGLGLRFVTALSLSHEWRPRAAVSGSVAYTALVALPAVGCPSGGPCLGTPDRLVAATVGLEPGVVGPAYAAVALGGGLLLGVLLGVRGAAPPHGFFAGCVASVAGLPVVAAASGEPAVVRTTALYLPVVLGTVAAVGGAVVYALRDGSERSSTGD
jgi:hypothetical protein